MPRFPTLVFSLTLYVLCAPAHSQSFDAARINFLKPSILKLYVTFRESISDANGQELCRSSGTAFILGPKYVVTAEHVFNFNPDCGEPIIVGRSFYDRQAQFLFSPVSAKADIAILEAQNAPMLSTEEKHGLHPCSLPISPQNVFDDAAMRYGVSTPLEEVSVLSGMIGSENNQFQPKVRFTQSSFDPGESGGPIVHGISAVGVMVSSVSGSSSEGIFLPISFLNDLIDETGIRLESQHYCELHNAMLNSIRIVDLPGFKFSPVLTLWFDPSLYGDFSEAASGEIARIVSAAMRKSDRIYRDFVLESGVNGSYDVVFAQDPAFMQMTQEELRDLQFLIRTEFEERIDTYADIWSVPEMNQ